MTTASKLTTVTVITLMSSKRRRSLERSTTCGKPTRRSLKTMSCPKKTKALAFSSQNSLLRLIHAQKYPKMYFWRRDSRHYCVTSQNIRVNIVPRRLILKGCQWLKNARHFNIVISPMCHLFLLLTRVDQLHKAFFVLKDNEINSC